MATKMLKNYPLSILCTLGIAVLSLAPIGAPEMAQDVPLFDKWAHFVMYGCLTIIVWWEMLHSKEETVHGSRLAVQGLICPVFLGGLMELCQANLTTYRSGEWLDFLANSIGVLLGCGIMLAYRAK